MPAPSHTRTVKFSPDTITTGGHRQKLVKRQIPDMVYVKTARAMSVKIPFVGLKLGTMPEIDTTTIYKPYVPEHTDASKGPLFDDEGVITEGYGACKLMDDWRDAIRYNAGAVYAQSWNDMGEDHHLLESNFRGDTYLQLNRYFADWFRYGKEPEIRKEKIFLFHRRHLKDAKLERKDYRLATNPSWSSAPVTDYVHVVTMLKQSGDLKVRLGRQEFTLKDVQPGLREWLLLVPVKKDHQGNHPFWNAGAYDVTHPVNTEYRKVTELEKLGSMLGCLDVEMQVSTLDYYLDQLKQSAEQAEQSAESRRKLYRYLGILSGAALAVLII